MTQSIVQELLFSPKSPYRDFGNVDLRLIIFLFSVFLAVLREVQMRCHQRILIFNDIDK